MAVPFWQTGQGLGPGSSPTSRRTKDVRVSCLFTPLTFPLSTTGPAATALPLSNERQTIPSINGDMDLGSEGTPVGMSCWWLSLPAEGPHHVVTGPYLLKLSSLPSSTTPMAPTSCVTSLHNSVHSSAGLFFHCSVPSFSFLRTSTSTFFLWMLLSWLCSP